MASASNTASNTAAFVIIHRDKKGTPDRIFSYEEDEATYVLVAINICRELLNHKKSQEALAEMVKIVREKHPHAWYETLESAEIVKEFVQVVLNTFPWVFVDNSFDNPNITGCHFRREYEGDFAGSQAICLNGPRIRDMCAAAKKARESKDPKTHQQYRTFVFLFAITLFHELGHVFITFLSRDGSGTPEELNAPGMHKPGQSEAGDSLEALVFGGTVNHARDVAYDESQPGAPHLIRAVDGGRISQKTVDEFVQCNFKVPFVVSDPPISDPLKQVGKSHKLPLLSDPMDPKTYPMLRKLVKDHVSNPFNFAELEKLEPSTSTRFKIQVGRQSVLAQKVLRPNLAIKVVE